VAEFDHRCPHCGRTNQVADGPSPESKPEPGDISICWRCGKVSVFAENGSTRLPTEEEAAEIQRDPEIRKALALRAECYTPQQVSKLRWGN